MPTGTDEFADNAGRVDEFADDVTFWDDVEAYPGRLSYTQGEHATLHVSTKGERYDIEIARQGPQPLTVHSVTGLPGTFTPPPHDADVNGCRWPESVRIPVGDDWPSGFYLVTVTAHGPGVRPGRDVAHAGFVVRPRQPSAPILWVLATNTWNAYNTWGGASLYTGGTQVAYGRPFGRGMLWRPEAERDDRKARPTRWGEEHDVDGLRFQQYRLARAYPAGIGSTGWHQYERRFAAWAEADGYRFDYAAQTDLDADPSIADAYDIVIGVGHDEYWSAAERDVVEAHVRRGGRYVSFSGNTMFWQVRPEDGSGRPDSDQPRTMVCWKYRAHREDPVLAEDPSRASGMWADPVVGRPEAAFLGAGSAWGLYSRFGQATPRGSGAFTVYRHDHWLLAGTGLRYGDLLGAAHGAVGYETVGCRIQFDEFQLPVRAGGDATPADLEIVAFTPASNCGVGEYPASIAALSDQGDLEHIAERIHGDLSEASLAKARYGNSVIVVARPFGAEAGEVVTVGTTDWVFGLADDEAVAQVTRNALGGGPK